MIDLFPEMEDCSKEGNISWFPNRIEKMKELLVLSRPKNIIEIGFNLGHSAKLICESVLDLKKKYSDYYSEEINFFIFDLGQYDCTKVNFEVLKEKYKGDINMNLVLGSTMETLSSFFEVCDKKFDFIEIDGCHSVECIKNDLQHTIDKISNEGIIYIDDYKSSKYRFTEIEQEVDNLSWENFSVDYIDGVFWAKKLK